jgi:glucose/arabinose dehydrogenase
VNPRLIIDLPALPQNGMHNGGKVMIGPDENVYLIVGDLGGYHTQTENYDMPSIGTSVIYRISQNGSAVEGILGNNNPTAKFYAYGIRNSFGMDFDPITGNLWDTENGLSAVEELNLVEPGFNSGWKRVEGPAELNEKFDHSDLYDFNGRGKYSDPEFTWAYNIAPTAVKFLSSNRFGHEYRGDLLIGDFLNGNIYIFDLNKNRTGLLLNGPLEDTVAEWQDFSELQKLIFAEGFGPIMDIQIGPDGYLYILSLKQHVPFGRYHIQEEGMLFRVKPIDAKPGLT